MTILRTITFLLFILLSLDTYSIESLDDMGGVKSSLSYSEAGSYSLDELFVLANELLKHGDYSHGKEILSMIKNYPRSYFLWGEYYSDKNNPFKDYSKAIENYKKSIELDSDLKNISYFKIGYILYEGLLGFRDLNSAKENWEMASSLGNKNASFGLGYLYETIENDPQKARYWYTEAIQQGSIEALLNLALLEYKQGDIDTSIQHLIISMASGSKKGGEVLLSIIKNDYSKYEDTFLKYKNAIIQAFKKRAKTVEGGYYDYSKVLFYFQDYSQAADALSTSAVSMESRGIGRLLIIYSTILVIGIIIFLIFRRLYITISNKKNNSNGNK